MSDRRHTSRPRTVAARVAALALVAGGGLAAAAPAHAATPATTEASAHRASPCALVGQGRVRGLHTRPKHVTLALAAQRGDTTVRITECRRVTRHRYVESWSTDGRIGRTGFAAPGAKREGDGHTPTGVYRLGKGFGEANPGTRMGYRTLTPRSCWGSTVGARTYNRYFTGECGPQDESMYDYVTNAYAQGMVIEYNTRPVRQGLGSAIFLHVAGSGPTAGCVAMPKELVTTKLRTTRPGDVIAMGTVADLVRR